MGRAKMNRYRIKTGGLKIEMSLLEQWCRGKEDAEVIRQILVQKRMFNVLASYDEKSREVELVKVRVHGVETIQPDKDKRSYGWIYSLKGGGKRYLAKNGIHGYFNESPYSTINELVNDLREVPHALNNHQFSVEDRAELPAEWDGFIHWEPI